MLYNKKNCAGDDDGRKDFCSHTALFGMGNCCWGTGMVFSCWPNTTIGNIVGVHATVFPRSATWPCAMVDDEGVGFLGDGG